MIDSKEIKINPGDKIIIIRAEQKSFELSKRMFSVEKKMNGFHCSIHQKGDEVRIFSEQKKDLTVAFPTLIENIKKISDKDFIIDGELVPYDDKGNILGRNELMKFVGALKSGKKLDDSNIKLHVWDIIYYEKPINELPLSERISYLGKLKFNNRVLEIERKIVGEDKLEEAINWASNLKGSEGTVVKDTNEPYYFGENKAWRKFRKLTPVNVMVLKKVPKERNLFNYLVGVKADKKYLDPNYINEKDYLVLGHTFNTKQEFNEGDKIQILIEEVWRHETKNGIHYSIHKPRVAGKTSEAISSIDYLENIVTSIGVAIKHSIIEGMEVLYTEEELKVKSDEGKEIEVKDFPDRMQENFRNMIGKWGNYVMQSHERGNSLHYDIRHQVRPDMLEGITLFGRSIQDRLPIETQRNNIRSTIKMPQPISWLTFEGITPRKGIGATKRFPGIFTIVSKGKFTVHEVTDHVIRIEYKSDSGKINKSIEEKALKENLPYPKDLPNELINLDGKYSWHVAHVGDHHIILFDKLKE